jgi:cytochrome oxidase Cu insertion factor (SCO1/SenC/PrrC family)
MKSRFVHYPDTTKSNGGGGTVRPWVLTAVTLGLVIGACQAQQLHLAAPGESAPGVFHLGAPVSEFAVRDMDGHLLTYSTLKGSVTAVIFFSTRCPISNAFNYRRNTLYKDFNGRVKFIVVDPNSNESMAEIKTYARDVEFDFPVYRDVNNVVADRFGAQLTTDTFLIDSSGILRYHGYIEESPNPTRAKNAALRLAIEAVLEGKPVAQPETRSLGCTIRRVLP